MNNKNLNQGGVPSCVPDDKYARQDSNLLNFPLKRAHQLQKLKKGGLKRKCQTTVLLVLPAAQLHYNRFLLTTSLPLLRF